MGREKRDREKEENEKFEKERKERLEKLEKKKKAEKERKEKERKEKEEKDALAKKEKEEKEAQAKKERDERRRKEREEREEKQKQTVKKEIPSDDVKDNDKPKKKLVPIKSKPKEALPKEKVATAEERKVDEATVVEKVSKAIASGEIDDSRVVKDEKDQIEEMETSPINHHDKDFAKVGDDDEDAELQRIKDEEEEEDNQDRVPDIGPSEDKKEADESIPRELDLEKAAPKVAYSHVKTPDEVDDLPEHEVVNPDESMLEEKQKQG